MNKKVHSSVKKLSQIHLIHYFNKDKISLKGQEKLLNLSKVLVTLLIMLRHLEKNNN